MGDRNLAGRANCPRYQFKLEARSNRRHRRGSLWKCEPPEGPGVQTGWKMTGVKTGSQSKAALVRVMIWGSALAAGFATGSLQALQPDFSFRVSFNTFIAFTLGSTLIYLYWKVLLNPSKNPRQKRLRWAASILLLLGGIAGFLYPLKFIAPNNFHEVTLGLLAAFAGLSVIALMLLICKRFLDKDSGE